MALKSISTAVFPSVFIALSSIIAACCLSGCQPPAEEPPEPAAVPVRSEILQPAPFRANVRLLGRVRAASSQEIRPLVSGAIHYPARFSGGLRTGEAVRKGELLFSVRNHATGLQLAEAELSARAAQSELDRAQRGVDHGFLPVSELKRREIEAELAQERLKNARLEQDRLAVYSPVTGVLDVERVTSPGAEVAPTQAIAEISGDGLPRVEAWASAADLDHLAIGQTVSCLAAGGKKTVGVGTITELSRQVDRAGVARLVVSIDDDRSMPRAGEGVELRAELPAKENALTVPEEAILIHGSVAKVFVLEPEGKHFKARSRLVELGGRSLDGPEEEAPRREVLEGLQAGDRIAVGGVELLADGLLAMEAVAGSAGRAGRAGEPR